MSQNSSQADPGKLLAESQTLTLQAKHALAFQTRLRHAEMLHSLCPFFLLLGMTKLHSADSFAVSYVHVFAF